MLAYFCKNSYLTIVRIAGFFFLIKTMTTVASSDYWFNPVILTQSEPPFYFFGDNKMIRLPIKNTNGKYYASEDGHIYCYSTSPYYSKHNQPVQLSEWLGSRGYKFVSMVVDGKRKSQNVHSIICSTWHGDRPQGQCCRHLDGNKENNHVSNLTWGTYKENEADKKRHGRMAIGERQGKSKLTTDAVYDIRKRVPRGLLTRKDAGKLYGVTANHITSVLNGRVWKHLL